MSNLFVLWLTAVPLMGSPGPATLSLAAVGAAYGVRPGLGYLAGIIAGTTLVLLVAATGITGTVFALPSAELVVISLGGAYILYLAWRIATAPPVARKDHMAVSPSYSGGLLLAVTNPKAYAAISAAYSSHHVIQDGVVLDAAAKVGALFAVIVVFNVVWLLFGGVMSGFLSDPRSSRLANIGFAVLLVLSMLFVVVRL